MTNVEKLKELIVFDELSNICAAMKKITKKDIGNAVRNGDIIITTRDIVKEAVKQAVYLLYDEVSDFRNNRYMTARDREFELLSEQQRDDIANEVLDYLLNE